MTQAVPPPQKKSAPKPTAETLVFKGKYDSPITDSLKVAVGFGKTHKSVLRAISLLECDADFKGKNFAAWSYIDARGKKQPSVLITKDGFTFLVTGFTGRRAAVFKQDYIAQFNKMEAELARRNQPLSLQEHTARATQLTNSKDVNKFNFEVGGKGVAISHNQLNCEIHTGQRPHAIKAAAKAAGVPARNRTSAKEVLRFTAPATACAMSMADNLVLCGIPIEQAARVTKKATTVFADLLNLGIGAAALDPGIKRLR